MDTMIDKLCSFVHNHFISIILAVLVIVCIYFNVKAVEHYGNIKQQLNYAKEYIHLLEEDAGEDYVLDVASGTDAYQNYYNN